MKCASLVPTQVCPKAAGLRPAGRAAVHDAHEGDGPDSTGALSSGLPPKVRVSGWSRTSGLRRVEAALCLLSYRDGSRGGIRTRELRLMRPARTTELLHPASAPPGTRTPNPLIKSQQLYLLS
jgi:hypothetical protein